MAKHLKYAYLIATAKSGDLSRFGQAMRSDGDQNGIASVKVDLVLSFKGEMQS